MADFILTVKLDADGTSRDNGGRSVRIIGGRHSGRRLATLSGTRTRPTGDRVREALFNIWQTRVKDAVFWDAYAGTGAIGLEAISRGASLAVFSETGREALKTLRSNIALLGAGDQTEVWAKSVDELLDKWRYDARRFDLVFMDPPWKVGISPVARESLWEVLVPGGMAVVESRQDQEIPRLPGLRQIWSRRYGDTRLSAFSSLAEVGS